MILSPNISVGQYYQEIADAEREHSRRLAAICSKAAKWESSKADLAAEDAASEEGSEELASALRLECGDTRSSIAQFYKAMNATNMAMSSGLKNISDLITEDIFQGISFNIHTPAH